jgi:Predicted nucleotide-binding protein containing TIR-like domain
METTNKEIRVFFSWQSDSPSETNMNAIRAALKKAAKEIKRKSSDFNIVLDEATRDTSGSPNIASKIFEKIDKTQVFIADITTITPENATRPSANPNVLVELGYAVAKVGWDRIVLLLNDTIGNFPSDLPFDIVQNRVSNYSLCEGTQERLNGAAALEKLLEIAIRAVIEKNPKTPDQLRGLTPEMMQHERDIKNLTLLLQQIHIPTLDNHILELPRLISDPIFFFWEGFKAILTSSLFHIYDSKLETSLVDLYESWNTTFSFCGRYRDINNGTRQIFSNPGDAPLDPDQQKDWDEINNAAYKMNQALQTLLARVRSHYIEVDINKTNAKAWKEYIDHEKKFIEMYRD